MLVECDDHFNFSEESAPSTIFNICCIAAHADNLFIALELANCDPEEVKRNIPNIVDIHRIVSKRDGKEIKTNTLILTFNLPKIPSSLKICYLNVPVTEYVPNPMRCYKCLWCGVRIAPLPFPRYVVRGD